MSVLTALAVLCGAVSLAGCSSHPDEGTFDGRLQVIGSPDGVSPRPLSGTVTFHGSDGNIATISLSANGRFTAHLPAGRYTVAGRSPRFEGSIGECRASAPVIVATGVTNRVEIDCRDS